MDTKTDAKMGKKVFFKTFGCRTNVYDTNIMISSLKNYEIVEKEDEADFIVVNSCTVTNSADAGARGYINTVSKNGAKVILAGCGAFSKGEELFKKEKVFGVFGHSEKANIENLLKTQERFFQIGDLESLDKAIVEDFSQKTRAFIKIQEGCNFRCGYCIIPFVRGNARSQKEELILEQIERLAANGYGEFILTGTNMGSYGRDVGGTLGGLVQKIGLIRGVRRIRLGSIEPIQIDESFKEILNESFLERHLHIALQHTNEEMLKIMRRRNSVNEDLKLFEFLAQKGFALGTDFIVGHPGESRELFLDAKKRLEDFPLTHIHAFTYSKRDGTPSANMKMQIRGDEAKERLREVVKIVEEKNYDFRRKQKNILNVLVEEKKDQYYTGYDQFYNKIFIDSKKDINKEWINIENYEVRYEANYSQI